MKLKNNKAEEFKESKCVFISDPDSYFFNRIGQVYEEKNGSLICLKIPLSDKNGYTTVRKIQIEKHKVTELTNEGIEEFRRILNGIIVSKIL